MSDIDAVGGLALHNSWLLLGLAALILVGYIALWLNNRPCSCPQCSFHVNERRVRLEEQRVERHRAFHKNFRIAWTEEACSACRNGGMGDKP